MSYSYINEGKIGKHSCYLNPILTQGHNQNFNFPAHISGYLHLSGYGVNSDLRMHKITLKLFLDFGGSVVRFFCIGIIVVRF